MKEKILSNAHIVTPDENFIGSVVIHNGYIIDVVKDKFYSSGVDLKQQWLLPGLIDIHSDYLEKEIHPRPSAQFPVDFAVHYMDARAAACGLTTVFSAVSFSQDYSKLRTFEDAFNMVKQFEEATKDTLVKHFLHARLDPNTNAVLDYIDNILNHKSLQLVVYNDSVPGERQFTLEYTIEMRAKARGVSKEEIRPQILQMIEERKKINHRPSIYKKLKDHVVLGSHDDTTAEHVHEAKKYGATLSEMPTTIEAARTAKKEGMLVCMGAPNYYRGGSHCGNLACKDAIKENLVDIICSDYHFPSMIACYVKMLKDGYSPSFAANLMTRNAADLIGLKNTGRIETGMKADLIAFDIKNTFGAVNYVFVDGDLKYNTQYPCNISKEFKAQPAYN
jgi:alpha-D-ribose 1-methylphosphonate 5-triphosphate diphosphatase